MGGGDEFRLFNFLYAWSVYTFVICTVFTDYRQKSSQDADKFSTLELTDVRYDDNGVYTAVASNSIGSATTCCALGVINKIRTPHPAVPEFVFGLPAALEAADSIALNAQVDAYRPVNVQWWAFDPPPPTPLRTNSTGCAVLINYAPNNVPNGS